MNITPLAPTPIVSGDTIGVIGLASPCEQAALDAGVSTLKSLGFKVKVALDPTHGREHPQLMFGTDTPERRARALEELFLDRNVRAIISTRGGYSSINVLEILNLSIVRSDPKWLVGFSDLTALMIGLYQAVGLPCVHGQMVAGGFAKYPADEAAKLGVEALLKILRGENLGALPGVVPQAQSNMKEFEGPVIGGNLTMLCSLIGTPWQADGEGHIIFFEDVGEKPYRLHRMLTQLKYGGFFAKAKGVVVGQLTDCEAPQPSAQNAIKALDVFKAVLSDTGVPVVSGFPAGHSQPNYPIVYGRTLKVTENSFIL